MSAQQDFKLRKEIMEMESDGEKQSRLGGSKRGAWAGLRLHPGIIASVIFVSAVAVAAAVLIIRKYCFPVNEATYKYSVLRQMEAEHAAVTEEEDGEWGPDTVGEESDEEILE